MARGIKNNGFKLLWPKELGPEESDDEDEDDDDSKEPRQSNIRDFDEANSVSDDLVHFLYENGMEEAVQNMFQVTYSLVAAKLQRTLIQTDLTQYFSNT